MTYATSADIENRLGTEAFNRLFDRNGDELADAAVVSEALAHADACIEVELRGVYELPLPAPVATYVKDIAADLAIGRAVRGTALGGTAGGAYAGLYEAAEKRLQRLRAIGGVKLADTEGTREAESFVVTNKRRDPL